MSPLRSSVLDALPPVMQLLLREIQPGAPVEDFYKRLDGMLPELRRQAEDSVSESVLANARQPRPPSTGQFVLNPSGPVS